MGRERSTSFFPDGFGAGCAAHKRLDPRYPRSSAFIRVHPRSSAFIRVHPRSSAFIRVHPRSSAVLFSPCIIQAMRAEMLFCYSKG
jgi:hypothetical protein